MDKAQYIRNHTKFSALLDDINGLIGDAPLPDNANYADGETMAGILACMTETHRRLSEWVSSPAIQAQREAEAQLLVNLIASLGED